MEKLCPLEKQAPMYVVIQQFIVSISYNEFVIIEDSGNLNFNKVIFNMQGYGPRLFGTMYYKKYRKYELLNYLNSIFLVLKKDRSNRFHNHS